MVPNELKHLKGMEKNEFSKDSSHLLFCANNQIFAFGVKTNMPNLGVKCGRLGNTLARVNIPETDGAIVAGCCQKALCRIETHSNGLKKNELKFKTIIILKINKREKKK